MPAHCHCVVLCAATGKGAANTVCLLETRESMKSAVSAEESMLTPNMENMVEEVSQRLVDC